MSDLTGKDRIIVALDVPTVDEAIATVERLDNISFFKVGLQLFMTGGLPTLLQALRHKRVFVDLKLPGDISNTIAAVIDACVTMNVALLTLSESMPRPAIRAARAARDARHSADPKFLTVPFLSSLDANDLPEAGARGTDSLDTVIVKRAQAALEAGCDGIIVSGEAIAVCRRAFPSTLIVSPGIRPAGASTDDHKRHTTPAEAIRLGADYLVVGRPIVKAPDPHESAQRIIEEVDQALSVSTPLR